MSREVHAAFCERLRVRFPRPTLLVIVVKGTKEQAEAIREECREVLEEKLKLTLNMEKTHVTHVNDGFTFLGHRLVRKRSGRGHMRVATTIPKEKARRFGASLTSMLSRGHSDTAVDMIESINRKLTGWANFYRYVNFRARVFGKIDRVVFWRFAHWLGRKYQARIAVLLRKWYGLIASGRKTWKLSGANRFGYMQRAALMPLGGRAKGGGQVYHPSLQPLLEHKRACGMFAQVRRCCNGCKPHLSGEPDALRGACPVR